MIAMSGNMGVTTTTHRKGKGGVLKALKRMIAASPCSSITSSHHLGPAKFGLAPRLPVT